MINNPASFDYFTYRLYPVKYTYYSVCLYAYEKTKVYFEHALARTLILWHY